MEKMIFNYYQIMKSIDPDFNWINMYWWRNKDNAKVILSGKPCKPNGFCIIGYNHFADKDVESEICEFYCENPFSILPLIRLTIKHIKYPLGFQVLVNNDKAIKVFELILKRHNINYKKNTSLDGNTKVFKYRIMSKFSI